MDFVSEQQNNSEKKTDFKSLSLQEQQKLVGAFVWLRTEDKKQNPEFYQRNKKKKND